VDFQLKQGIIVFSYNCKISLQFCELNFAWICQTPCVILLCSSRNWNFGWKYWSLGDDLVQLLHTASNCFNYLVGYDLHQLYSMTLLLILFCVMFHLIILLFKWDVTPNGWFLILQRCL